MASRAVSGSVTGMRQHHVALALAVTLLAACSTGDCPQPVLPSFSVTVVDAVTDANLSAIATGTIVRGSYHAPFTQAGNRLIAGQNQWGTFTVSLTAPGYAAWQDVVHVGFDGCNIVTRELRVALVPE